MTTLILDTETTGIKNHPDKGHPEVIQMAYMKLLDYPDLNNINSMSYPMIVEHYLPSMEIEETAYTIHGLSMEYLEEVTNRESSEAVEDIKLEEPKYILGYNISYDMRCLGKPLYKTICLMKIYKKISKLIDLETTDHKLHTLYPLVCKVFDIPEISKNVYHQADVDVYKTYILLLHLVKSLPNLRSFDDLYNYQQTL